MRLMMACCALPLVMGTLLAGCGKNTDAAEGLEVAAEAGTTIPAAVATPCTGPILPLTGVCATPSPGLFLAVDGTIKPFGDKCVWTTQEVAVSDNQALVFRSQDCGAEGWPVMSYSFAANKLTASYPSDPGSEPHAGVVLEVFPLGTGQTAEQVALQTLAGAPADQRAQCVTTPIPDAHVAGKAFDLGPNEALTKRLDEENMGEVYDACGPYGFTDAVQFWEARPGRVLFQMQGQDDPLYDPKSFTFYVKNPDGSWSKEA